MTEPPIPQHLIDAANHRADELAKEIEERIHQERVALLEARRMARAERRARKSGIPNAQNILSTKLDAQTRLRMLEAMRPDDSISGWIREAILLRLELHK